MECLTREVEGKSAAVLLSIPTLRLRSSVEAVKLTFWRISNLFVNRGAKKIFYHIDIDHNDRDIIVEAINEFILAFYQRNRDFVINGGKIKIFLAQ